jgi:hypothetical protein
MSQRKRPAPPQNRPLRHYTDIAKEIAYRRQDGYASPTADDRADLDVLIAAAERGFRLAIRCLRCNQWLVAPSSVRAHLGPVCRVKVVDG